MGLVWSDILYPDNPRRREEVNKLAESIRISVIQIHSNVRTVSISLNQAYDKFEVLPLIDMNSTYDKVFENIDALLAQWKRVTQELELDPSIPQEIKQLMAKFEQATSVGQLPAVVGDVVNDPSMAGSVAEPVTGLLVGSIASFFVQKQLSTILTSTVAAVTTAGLLGSLIGVAAGLVAALIIGAIEGAKERETLENLIHEYGEMDRNLSAHLEELEQGVGSVQRAIIRALPF